MLKVNAASMSPPTTAILHHHTAERAIAIHPQLSCRERASDQGHRTVAQPGARLQDGQDARMRVSTGFETMSETLPAQ